MRNILIAIAFTVFLLVVKDNLNTFWNIIKNIGNILTPFFIGFLIAYILNFPYKFLYNKAFKRMGTKHKFAPEWLDFYVWSVFEMIECGIKAMQNDGE